MTDKVLLDRFTEERDEAAFEGIVRRHGPLVLRICRRLLNDPHEAEDAFQGTFVVLARNAGSIRDREALAPWLGEVAARVSKKARWRSLRQRSMVTALAIAKRTGSEGSLMSTSESRTGPDPERCEVFALLHSEVDLLPEECRSAIVSCYLEGQTQEEAAKGLGLPLGTLKGRLRQGRELLRSRLARRGVAMSLALILLLLEDSTAKAEPVLPESLVRKTVKAALAAAERKAATIAWPTSLGPLVATLAVASAFLVAAWLGGFYSKSTARASVDVIDAQPVNSHEALQNCEHDKDGSRGK